MNILILTDALTAPLYIPRIRFLNSQLLTAGHHVTWYAERSPNDIPDDLRPANLIEIPYYHSFADRILKAPLILFYDHKNRFFEHNIRPSEKPDIIFVSAFLTFGLRAGLALSRRYSCPLHIDLRDIAEQTPLNSYSRSRLSTSRIYRAIHIRRRNAVLRCATTVTTVSRFQQQLIAGINPNTHLIYNGYDAELFRPTEKPEPSPLSIVYTGRWYGSSMQDPSPLFAALGQADFDYTLTFYTGKEVHEEIGRVASRYAINPILRDYIPNSEIPEVLGKAHVALVLTSPSNRGILTTKFFEALGTHTPVLCTPSDCGELASLVRTTDAGLASSDPDEILAWLRHPKPSNSNQQSLTFYSRQYQTQRLIRLICGSTGSPTDDDENDNE